MLDLRELVPDRSVEVAGGERKDEKIEPEPTSRKKNPLGSLPPAIPSTDVSTHVRAFRTSPSRSPAGSVKTKQVEPESGS